LAKPSPLRPDLGLFFIIFVDRIFTRLVESLFTNFFDAARPKPRITCLWRACNAN